MYVVIVKIQIKPEFREPFLVAMVDNARSSEEKEAKRILGIPAHMKIAYACRLGYPISEPGKGLRVRRGVKDFTHHNRFGSRGLHKKI